MSTLSMPMVITDWSVGKSCIAIEFIGLSNIILDGSALCYFFGLARLAHKSSIQVLLVGAGMC